MSAVAACGHDLAKSALRQAVYQPRRPERTVVYQVVQRHLETWLELARASDGGEDPVPSYVERDFRQYLTLQHPGQRLCQGALRLLQPRLLGRARDAWAKRPRTWWIISFPKFRCGNGY